MSSLDRKMHRNAAARAAAAGEGLPDIVKLSARLVIKALAALEKILDDPHATAATILRAANSVLDRVYGKSGTNHSTRDFQVADPLAVSVSDPRIAPLGSQSGAAGGVLKGPLPGLGG